MSCTCRRVAVTLWECREPEVSWESLEQIDPFLPFRWNAITSNSNVNIPWKLLFEDYQKAQAKTKKRPWPKWEVSLDGKGVFSFLILPCWFVALLHISLFFQAKYFRSWNSFQDFFLPRKPLSLPIPPSLKFFTATSTDCSLPVPLCRLLWEVSGC